MIYILWSTARPDVFEKSHKVWIEKATNPRNISTKVAVDSQKDRSLLLGYDVSVVNNPRHGITTPLYHLTKNLRAEPKDIIVVASDDFFPPDNWDQYLTAKLDNFDGALWVNDGHGKKIISIPIMTFSCLQWLNKIIYHPIYNHMFSDQELWDILYEHKKLRDCRTDVKQFTHQHPTFTGQEYDEVNVKANEKFKDNKLIYNSRKPLLLENKLKVKKLSILICSLSSRPESLQRLEKSLNKQITDDVEIMTMVDDGSMEIGTKRNVLVRQSLGEYVVFIDDDDEVSDDYIPQILEAIESGPDVVGITVEMTVNGKNPEIGLCSMRFKEWATIPDKEHPGRKKYIRTPHHLCPVRREIALKCPFPDTSFGEDRFYSNAIKPYLKTESFISKTIYFYRYVKGKPKHRKVELKADYYGQIGQDKFIREHFMQFEDKGFFVEIGAYDGITFSNSLHFEKSGWDGICVEPNPEMFKELKKNRSCKCVSTCVWDKEATVDFLTVSGKPADSECKMLTGIQKSMDERHKIRFKNAAQGAEIITLKLKTITLNQLLDDAKVTHVNYCSLDTEGSEFDILKSFDFEKYTVDVFSVENNFNEDDIRRFMATKGYSYYKVKWDDIYYKI